jgi:hypothetical protein
MNEVEEFGILEASSWPTEEKCLLKMFGNSEELDDNIFLLGHLRDVICLLFFLVRLMRLFIPSPVFLVLKRLSSKYFV